MIHGAGAVALNLLFILFFSLFLVAIVAAIISSVGNLNLGRYSLPSRRRVLWFAALTPWIIGIVTACLSIFVDSRYQPADGFNLFHWHHSQEFNLASWHGITLLVGISIVSFLLLKAVFRLITNARQLKLLYQLAEENERGFYQLEAEKITAFTAGIIKPRCYITNGLLQQLSAQELTIVQLHESAHAKSFDPLKKWLFQLLTSFYPVSVSRQMNICMTLVMEQSADARVARVVKDKSLIAETLLKVKKLASASTGNNVLAPVACHYAMDNVEERINYLINRQKETIFPLLPVVLAITTLAAFCGFSADAFHHVIEFTLSH